MGTTELTTTLATTEPTTTLATTTTVKTPTTQETTTFFYFKDYETTPEPENPENSDNNQNTDPKIYTSKIEMYPTEPSFIIKNDGTTLPIFETSAMYAKAKNEVTTDGIWFVDTTAA